MYLTGIYGNYYGKNDSIHGSYLAELDENLETSNVNFFKIKSSDLANINYHQSEKREKLTKFLFEDVMFNRLSDEYPFLDEPLLNLNMRESYFEKKGDEITIACSKIYQGAREFGPYVEKTKDWEEKNNTKSKLAYWPVKFNLNTEILIFKFDLTYGFSWATKIERFAYYDHVVTEGVLTTRNDVSIFKKSDDLFIIYKDLFKIDGTMTPLRFPVKFEKAGDNFVDKINLAKVSIKTGNIEFEEVPLVRRINLSNIRVLNNEAYIEYDGKGYGMCGKFEN